mmetsp:Transcript_33322/g.79021  ORF Transcript_33322/g.79021 Transcript_33322/m.79021 type:complete len:165 (+) Transcript_33322:91-585(+)
MSLAPKLLTLVIVQDGSRILLGKKKRGFGEGYFNGFGGKVEPGEKVSQAALRELKEEAGISAKDLELRGVLTFNFDDKPQPWEVHVFRVSHWSGQPAESDEMIPQWFHSSSIPYEQMWADDPYWYPLFLEGKRFTGTFDFRDTHSLVSHSLREAGEAELLARSD